MLFKLINPEIFAAYAKAKQAYLEEIARDEKEKMQLAGDIKATNSKADSSVIAGPYLSVKEAAQLTRLSPSNIRLLIRRGKLPAQHVGRRVIIKREDAQGIVEKAQPTRLSA
jgi:excisionase family DNA binding protein